MEMNNIRLRKNLVTGAAGFIGSRLAFELAKRGDNVVDIDNNINDYCDVLLKYGRLRECGIDGGNFDMPWNKECTIFSFPNLRFLRLSIDDKEALDKLFERKRFDIVMNLAA